MCAWSDPLEFFFTVVMFPLALMCFHCHCSYLGLFLGKRHLGYCNLSKHSETEALGDCLWCLEITLVQPLADDGGVGEPRPLASPLRYDLHLEVLRVAQGTQATCPL